MIPPIGGREGIQNAIDDIESGQVFLSPGTFMIDAPIVLPSSIELLGSGVNATLLKMEDGANLDALIKSKDFDDLTDSNLWFVDTEGVPYGMGIKNLSVDGNKINQTSGDGGIKLYAKRYTIDDVLIRDCYGIGFYSECARRSGQHDWRDLPESVVGPLWVRGCGSHGVLYRGPHDGRIKFLVSAINGGSGFISEGLANSSGACDIGFIHAYANQEPGVMLKSTCQALHIKVSGVGGGVKVSGNNTSIGYLHARGNIPFGLDVVAKNFLLNSARISDCTEFALRCTGSRGWLNNVFVWDNPASNPIIIRKDTYFNGRYND